MNGPEVGKLEKEQNLKSIVMNEWSPKVDNLEISENCENDEETMSQSEERLCKSIIRGLARRNREEHTMLAGEQDVICFDDITGKELPWHAVREARELELKYLRDLGVHEKVDEKEAVEKYGNTHSSGHEVGRHRQSVRGRANACDENSKVMIGRTCMQGLLHWRR